MTVPAALLWAALGQTLLIVVISWVLPYLARREFLFGVYITVGREKLLATRRIFRVWTVGIVVLGLAAGTACLGLWMSGWIVAALSLPPLAVVIAGTGLYLLCHNHSRHYGLRSPRIAVAPVPEIPLVRDVIPLLMQALPWGIALALLVWTFLRWDEIPHSVPGLLDPGVRQPRSVLRVFAGPLLAFACLLLPLHLVSWAFSRTKPPLEAPQSEIARKRAVVYRRAFAWYLWGLGMLMALAVAFVQWNAVRGMIDQEVAGTRGPLAAALTVTLAGLLGAVLLAARVTHGLGPLPEGQPDRGVDQRRWVAGLFYFNPEDPALLVRQRFGLAINFGNRRALTLALVLVILVLSLAMLPLIVLLARS